MNIDTNLKAKKPKCEKLLRNYYTLPLTIECMYMTLEASVTSSYILREGQSHSTPSSPVETVAMKREVIENKENEYKLLDQLRDILHPDHVQLWDYRYHPRHQYNDSQTIVLMGLDHNQYYKLKTQLIGHVADVFGLWDDKKDG